METSNLIAILGAAGATGQAVSQELAARGARLRLVGRRAGRLPEIPGAERVEADLETPDGARRALAGVETAVLTLGLPYDQFGRYPALMRNLVSAAEAAGVRRFLLVTSLYSYGLPQTDPVTETHPRTPQTFKGRMRHEQERVLEASALEWIILRLPDFYGPAAEQSHAHMILAAARAGKPADLFYPATTPHQFVYTPDVGPVVADLLARADGWRETYHFAGSGLTTVEAFAREAFAAAGRPFRARVARKWMMRLMGLFSPLMRELAEMFYLHETPVNLDDRKLERHLGPLRRTPYAVGIRACLAAR